MWIETLETVDATLAFGAALGRVADCETRVALMGDLGAGKTSLAQGVGVGLGLITPVVSPTFILLAEYEDGRIPLLHGDAYRLGEGDAQKIGMDETVEDWPGIVLMEWADLVPAVLDSGRLIVRLTLQGDMRRVDVSAIGSHHEAVLERWREAYSE